MLQIVRLAEWLKKPERAKGIDQATFAVLLSKYFSDDPCDPIEEEGKREEMDTVGSLYDKLAIVTTRMWHAQDDLYRYRRMSSEEWHEEFKDDLDKVRTTLVRACELNLQRNTLIDEIDSLLASMFEMDSEERKKLYQPKHKMY